MRLTVSILEFQLSKYTSFKILKPKFKFERELFYGTCIMATFLLTSQKCRTDTPTFGYFSYGTATETTPEVKTQYYEVRIETSKTSSIKLLALTSIESKPIPN